MKNPFAASILIGLWIGLICLPTTVKSQEKIPQNQLEFFEKKIRPVLIQHCYSCHAKDSKSVKGGLVLDTRDGIRHGGDSGHAVVPGEQESSLIMEAIRYESFEMPPKEKLPESVIADFEKWIEMGAPDPREGPSLIKREIDFNEAKNHWSFQPIKKTKPPAVKNNDWPRADVDRFVLAKLESENLKPVGDADRITLIRRLYYDLIGLPPTPQQLETALADQSSDAIEKLVDQLLGSPQFGERWGRHWLDVVRYAESNGRERNHVYPQAWRFRDYVISAFNSDKPFDQFIREQIAGDLLDDAGNEQLVATGFLAIGPKLLNERNREIFVMDIVDEQIDVSTRAFMGLTVSCARCHDHKFDPIPTSEYYSMAGIFRSTQTLFGTEKTQGNRQSTDLIRLVSGGEEEKQQAREAEKLKREIQQNLKNSQLRLAKLQKENKALAVNRKNKNKSKTDPAKIAEVRKSIANTKKRVQALQKELKTAGDVGGDKAMGVREGKVADSPIYVRGEVGSPKGKAPRGLLTILDPHLNQPLLETRQSGRLELANWIANEKNTMTTRVIVNRVWQHLFGKGLVGTVDNFGATGDPPSHPELLDHLATRFAHQGWSVKKLIRELVLTRTYQLSGVYQDVNYQSDPGNVYLWRYSPKRLEAESIRDAILLASGNLELEPANASPVSRLKGEYGRRMELGNEVITKNVHRSVYLPIVRNAVPEALKLFDFAEPSILVGERPTTTVPTQALFFLNSKFVMQQCDQLTSNLLADESLNDQERIDLAYRTILSRPADKSEVKRAMKFINQTNKQLAEPKSGSSESRSHAWSGFCQTLFGSAEFRYVE